MVADTLWTRPDTNIEANRHTTTVCVCVCMRVHVRVCLYVCVCVGGGHTCVCANYTLHANGQTNESKGRRGGREPEQAAVTGSILRSLSTTKRRLYKGLYIIPNVLIQDGKVNTTLKLRVLLAKNNARSKVIPLTKYKINVKPNSKKILTFREEFGVVTLAKYKSTQVTNSLSGCVCVCVWLKSST